MRDDYFFNLFFPAGIEAGLILLQAYVLYAVTLLAKIDIIYDFEI